MRKTIISFAVLFFFFSQAFSQNTFPSSGNVGIGTTSPSVKLDINSPDNDGSTRLRIANTTSSGVNSAGSFPTVELMGARGDGNTSFEGRLALGSRRTDGNALSNQTLGVVMFGGQYGTDNSFQANKISYPSSIQGIAEGSFSNASTMPTAIAFLTGSVGNDVATPNLSYGTERMRITSGGNVGIGTTSPDQNLTINSATGVNSLVSFKQNATTTAYVGLGMDGVFRNETLSGTELRLQADGANLICMYTNAAERIRITSNGNIGIGTSNPGSFKLAVEGKIGAREIKVTLANPWPGYVFYHRYKLLPLNDLEKYIQNNGHLPNIPSANEVKEKDGIQLGDMSVKLLEKIEELTLYIIQLKKDNEVIKEENKEIKEELKRLSEKK